MHASVRTRDGHARVYVYVNIVRIKDVEGGIEGKEKRKRYIFIYTYIYTHIYIHYVYIYIYVHGDKTRDEKTV